MKKNFLIFLLLILSTVGFSQKNFNLNDPLPLYENVVYGKLDNGMTYYILKNSEPQNRAFLQLVVNAGSVFEDEDQKGLAHMCEHMAFNGTKNFPKNALIKYMESIGMQFGDGLNAYTGFDETVYMLEVPLDTTAFLENGLKVLYDWACNVSYEDVEVNNERKVIYEEQRLGRGADDRLSQKTYPALFYNSIYANRLPIGDTAVFMTCPPENLRRFYRDWYRPDLQAIVAVGDFDVAQVEKFIKTIFSQIPKRDNVRPHKYPDVPQHENTIVKVATDPEASYIIVSYNIKSNAEIVKTYADFKNMIIEDLATGILDMRLNDIASGAGSPFSYAWSYKSNFVGNTDIFSAACLAKDGFINDAVKTIAIELKRAAKFGFTLSELDRQKSVSLSQIKKYYDERLKYSSDRWADILHNNFTQFKSPALGFEKEYELYQYFLPQITLEDLNIAIQKIITADNNVITITAPEVKVPTEQEVTDIISNIKNDEIKPYEDKKIAENLISKEPTAGKVVSEQKDDITGTITWTLSNGIKIVIKQTDFKDNEILLNAYSWGGYSLYSIDDNLNAKNCTDIAMSNGMGDFNLIDFQKYMSDKNVQLTPFIGQTTEGFSGKSTKDDFEVMIQMIYLYFTAPKFEDDAFTTYIDRQKSLLDNRANDPQSLWQDNIGLALANNSPYVQPLTKDNLSKLNNKRAAEIFKERFSDAASFSFLLVGSVDLATVKPIVEKYLGSLPAVNKNEKFVDLGIRYPKGIVNADVKKGTDPKSLVITFLQGFEKNSLYNEIYLNAMVYVFDDSLINQIREEKQWTYSISAFPRFQYFPVDAQLIGVFYSSSPERVDSINYEIMRIAKNLTLKDLPKEQVDKTIEKIKRKHETDLRDNSYWLNKLTTMQQTNSKPDFVTDYDKIVNGINAATFKKAAKKLLKGTYISVALKPEK